MKHLSQTSTMSNSITANVRRLGEELAFETRQPELLLIYN